MITIIITDKEVDMRNTKQRDLILRIVEMSCDHPTAEMIYERAREEMPALSLGTVYRNLSLLVSQGKVRHVVIPTGGDRYDKTICTHAHLHCRVCNGVVDVGEGLNDKIARSVEDISGCKIDTTDIIFVGICPECKKLA